MPETAQRRLDMLKQQFEKLARLVPADVSQAVRDFFTATNYDDDILVKSSLNSVFEALIKLVQDIIQQELTISENAKNELRGFWAKFVEGEPSDNLDEIRKVIESVIDQRLARLTSIRDELVKVMLQRDYQPENAQQLEDGIRDLRKFKEKLLKNWPRQDKQPGPIDREAIEEARMAIARGEKGMSREELVHPKTKRG